MALNISFDYLYRDAGNNKLFESAIFKNKTKISPVEVGQIIQGQLFQNLYFIPATWRLYPLKFERFNPNLDHNWHELDGIAETYQNANDLRDIKDFLEEIKAVDQNQFFIDEFLNGDDPDISFHHS